jgi:hypothetical protein
VLSAVQRSAAAAEEYYVNAGALLQRLADDLSDTVAVGMSLAGFALYKRRPLASAGQGGARLHRSRFEPKRHDDGDGRCRVILRSGRINPKQTLAKPQATPVIVMPRHWPLPPSSDRPTLLSPRTLH